MDKKLLYIITGSVLALVIIGGGIYWLRNRDVGVNRTPSGNVALSPSSGNTTSSTVNLAEPPKNVQQLNFTFPTTTRAATTQTPEQIHAEIQAEIKQREADQPKTTAPTTVPQTQATSIPTNENSSALDPDKDGLTTNQELQLGTDPNNPDTDLDGLTDGQEVNTYKTDPKNPDTDNDTYSDGQEVKSGYNPLGPGKCPTANCIP